MCSNMDVDIKFYSFDTLNNNLPHKKRRFSDLACSEVLFTNEIPKPPIDFHDQKEIDHSLHSSVLNCSNDKNIKHSENVGDMGVPVFASSLNHRGITTEPVCGEPIKLPETVNNQSQSHISQPSPTLSSHLNLPSDHLKDKTNCGKPSEKEREVQESQATVEKKPKQENISSKGAQVYPCDNQNDPSGDWYVLQNYTAIWRGSLVLKNDEATVQMHFVSGNLTMALGCLPPLNAGQMSSVRISQRMKLVPQELQGVYKKIQAQDQHSILIAVPYGKSSKDIIKQSSNLKDIFINYLECKKSAGIVNAAVMGAKKPEYVIHIFPPSCEFTDMNLGKIAPDLFRVISDIAHLMIVIAVV